MYKAAGCQLGKYYFDFNTSELVFDENVRKLTTKEAALLKLFCNNKNKTLLRSFALRMVWGDDSYFNARSMDVYITKLRKYLKEDKDVKILTIHGEGFKLLVAPNSKDEGI
jgi:DNA-binding response OmpR family regulator